MDNNSRLYWAHTWVENRGGSGDNDDDDIYNIDLEWALEQWENAIASGGGENFNIERCAFQCYNYVEYGTALPGPDDFATTGINYFSGPDWIEYIDSFGIQINPSRSSGPVSWIAGDPGGFTSFDSGRASLRDIITHEVGHAVGAGHCDNWFLCPGGAGTFPTMMPYDINNPYLSGFMYPFNLLHTLSPADLAWAAANYSGVVPIQPHDEDAPQEYIEPRVSVYPNPFNPSATIRYYAEWPGEYVVSHCCPNV